MADEITGTDSTATTSSKTGQDNPAITDPKELDAAFGIEAPADDEHKVDKDHPEKDAKKPDVDSTDHPEDDKKPEGAEEPGEGKKTPEEDGEKDGKLYAGKYKSPEDLEKAYNEINALQLKKADESKNFKDQFEKQIKDLEDRIESYKDGNVIPDTGQDLLNRLIVKDPDNKAHYEELFNSLGEEAFKAQHAIINTQLDSIRKETEKLREKNEMAEMERSSEKIYSEFAEKYPEAKDEGIKDAIHNVAAEFTDTANLDNHSFQLKTCLDIVKGRRSKEDFVKAVNAESDIKAKELIKKQLSDGLLVRKSASTGGEPGKTETEKELDNEWGEGTDSS